jgi:hypothetical protein
VESPSKYSIFIGGSDSVVITGYRGWHVVK